MERMPTVYTPMGITAENVAKRFEISRAGAGRVRAASQSARGRRLKDGKFADEIVPVNGHPLRRTERAQDLRAFNVDEMPRADTTVGGPRGLARCSRPPARVTAGNASPLSDGAAASLVMSKAEGRRARHQALGYFRAFVTAGVDPAIMGIGPIPRCRSCSRRRASPSRHRRLRGERGLREPGGLREAQLGLPDDKLNVNGGAIALGHPLGCTGAKLTATALYELKRRGGRYAIVTMCIGGGMGAAGLFESTRSTWLGNLSFVYFVGAVSLLGVRAFVRLRRGDPRARAELIGIVALLMCGINDSFVSSGALEMPYLLDVGYLVMIAAITVDLAREFVQNARDLRAAQAALVSKERLAALGEMSAVVAHEVRNPVAIIFNAVATLRKRPDDPEKLLGIVEEEAERLKRMVSDLLEFARPTSLVLDQHEVARIVSDAVDALRTASPDAPVDVEVDVVEPSPRVRCDSRLMRQAVINLLANAIAAPHRSRPVAVVISAEGDEVAVRVVDDGGGVDAAVVDTIFSPFFTTRATGTGLGLPVVKRIAEAHGGRVRLENRPGVGATFVLMVPRAGPRTVEDA
jgi:signal transduction histidine kinase